MKFNALLNKYLVECNAKPLEGIMYYQYMIIEKNGFFYIFNESRDKIISSAKTLKQSKEMIDSIISGC